MNPGMELHQLQQGSPEWHAHRAACYCASDAPAMLGLSPYETRGQLLERLATGYRAEPTESQQYLYDRGHAQEAVARRHAEQQQGEELYAVTATRRVPGLSRPLSASFDGVNLSGDTAFEHKLLNAELREALARGFIPNRYRPQLEQQLLVLGTGRVLFMASTGTGANMEVLQCWYESNPELRAMLLRGWQLLDADLQARLRDGARPQADVAPLGRQPGTLPALRVEVSGSVTASNLGEFRAAALSAFRAVNTDLQTDQDFADAAEAVRWCEDVEARLAAAKEHALSQTVDVARLFRTLDEIAAESARVRRHLSGAITARKDAVKREICEEGRAQLRTYCEQLQATLQAELGLSLSPLAPLADFPAAVKSRRSVATMRDAVQTELARARTEALRLADNARANAASWRESGLPSVVLPELPSRLTTDPEQFQLLLQARAAQVEAERQRRAVPAVPAWTEVPPLPTAAPARPDPLASVLLPRVPLPATVDAPTAAPEKIRVRHICEALGMTLTLEQLRRMGVEPSENGPGGAVFWRRDALPSICEAVAQHAMRCAAAARAECTK